MTLGPNVLLEERLLEVKVVLLAEKAGHTAIVILEGTNWGAFCLHSGSVEPVFLKYLSEALCLTSLSRHFLWLPAEFDVRVIHWNHSIFLFSLFPPI